MEKEYTEKSLEHDDTNSQSNKPELLEGLLALGDTLKSGFTNAVNDFNQFIDKHSNEFDFLELIEQWVDDEILKCDECIVEWQNIVDKNKGISERQESDKMMALYGVFASEMFRSRKRAIEIVAAEIAVYKKNSNIGISKLISNIIDQFKKNSYCECSK